MKSWQSEVDLVQDDITGYITNPLNAFLLIKRYTSDLRLIQRCFPEDSDPFMDFIDIIVKFEPDHEDLVGAVSGLLRLQQTYKLQTADFGNGIIDGKKTRSGLSAHDLFIIGEEANSFDGKQLFAQEYLALAYEKVRQGLDVDNEVDVNRLLTMLYESYSKSGDLESSLKLIDDLIERSADKKNLKEMKEKISQNLKKVGKSKNILQDPFSETFTKDGMISQEKDEILFNQICRGDVSRSPREVADLKCRYDSKTNYAMLGPFKVEEVNLDPYIVLYLDVLSDSDIEKLKENSKTRLERAVTVGIGNNEKSNKRISQVAWINDFEDKVIKKISQRVEDMTGLDLTSSEALQVQNYGIGGHYTAHFDHLQYLRIATTMFYVSTQNCQFSN